MKLAVIIEIVKNNRMQHKEYFKSKKKFIIKKY